MRRETIRDLPTLQPPITCEHSATIRQAIEVMQRERRDCVLVVDLGRLVGVFTAWDVLTKVAARGIDIDRLRIGTLMTPNPDCLHMDDELAYALNQMSVWDYQHIPLIDDHGRPTGIVTMRRYSSSSMPKRQRRASSGSPRRTAISNRDLTL